MDSNGFYIGCTICNNHGDVVINNGCDNKKRAAVERADAEEVVAEPDPGDSAELTETLKPVFHDSLNTELVCKVLEEIFAMENRDGTLKFTRKNRWIVVQKVFAEMFWLCDNCSNTLFRHWVNMSFSEDLKKGSYDTFSPSLASRHTSEWNRSDGIHFELAQVMKERFWGDGGSRVKEFVKPNRILPHKGRI